MIGLIVEHKGSKKLLWQDDREDYNFNELRIIEKEVVTSNQIPTEHKYMAIYDVRYYLKIQAALNILQTIFVCIILSVGAMFFQRITSLYVVNPIEHMIEKVKQMS